MRICSTGNAIRHIFRLVFLFIILSLVPAHAKAAFCRENWVANCIDLNRSFISADTSLNPKVDTSGKKTPKKENSGEPRERMPLFAGSRSPTESQEKIIHYIRKNLQYPDEARNNGIEGTVYVRFIILQDGSITDVKAQGDWGGGLREEAERIVKSMPRWIPGIQNGKPVAVSFSLPVKFQL